MKNAWLAKLIAVAVVAAWLGPVFSAGEGELAVAQEAAADYRYGLAFEHFRAAAAQGNGQAQLSAGLMVLYGERLFGAEVARDRHEAQKWFTRAAAQGCLVSRYMLHHLATGGGEPPLALAATLPVNLPN